MRWSEGAASDDVAGRNAEQVFTATDAAGCSWLVAPHDDGTWNLFRKDARGEIVDHVYDLPTSTAAIELANARDAALQALDDGPPFVR